MAQPANAEDQREAPPLVCVLAIAGAALLLALEAAAPLWSVALALAAAVAWGGAARVVPGLPVRRQTVGELAAAGVCAALVAGVVVGAGVGASVVCFAGAVLAGLATLCTIWQTSVMAIASVVIAVGAGGLVAGSSPLLVVAAALGLAAFAGSLSAALVQQRERVAMLARRLRRSQGELQSHHGAEQELRATHDSLERQAQALGDSHRRMEREMMARRSAEEQVLELARLKDSFLQIVSHELRTPLNAVIGYTEILLEEDPETPLRAVRGEHEKIDGAARRLLELIDDLLDLAKLEAGAAAVAVASIDVPVLAEQVLAGAAGAAAANGDTIRLRCEERLPALESDPAKLRRILLHLLNNACKFTQGGVVRLDVRFVREQPACFVFEVADTGIGMDAAVLARIFAPFVQADGSTTRRYEGTGLGLALCRHYCRMLGGEITATSTPGHGSTFTVRVPAQRIDPATSIVQSNF